MSPHNLAWHFFALALPPVFFSFSQNWLSRLTKGEKGMSDIEESLKRITSHNGVMGVAVLDDAGKLARSLSDLLKHFANVSAIKALQWESPATCLCLARQPVDTPWRCEHAQERRAWALERPHALMVGAYLMLSLSVYVGSCMYCGVHTQV